MLVLLLKCGAAALSPIILFPVTILITFILTANVYIFYYRHISTHKETT